MQELPPRPPLPPQVPAPPADAPGVFWTGAVADRTAAERVAQSEGEPVLKRPRGRQRKPVGNRQPKRNSTQQKTQTTKTPEATRRLGSFLLTVVLVAAGVIALVSG